MSRLRTLLYARLEEMSFRSGAAVSAAVLVVIAVVFAFAVMPGGHPAAAPRRAGAALAPVRGSAVLSAPAPGPSPTQPARSVSHRAGSVAPGPGDAPDASVRRSAAPQAPSASSPFRLLGGPEPAWPRAHRPPAGPPPPWMLPWPWDQRWPGHRSPR